MDVGTLQEEQPAEVKDTGVVAEAEAGVTARNVALPAATNRRDAATRRERRPRSRWQVRR